jgi:hypothetical protein
MKKSLVTAFFLISITTRRHYCILVSSEQVSGSGIVSTPQTVTASCF